MGLFTDIRKKLNGTPSNGLDGQGEHTPSSGVTRGKSTNRPQQPRRPQGLDAGSESQDSGVVIVHKDSQMTLSSVPDYACPSCAATAAAAAPRGLHTKPRPSMEAMQPYMGSRPLPPIHGGHTHDHPHSRIADASHDHSRPGTGYSNHSALLPMQAQPHRQNHHKQQHDPGFSQRPVSWGRRATTENVAADIPPGYTRPVTPPYSVSSEQTGWNSGQQYNNMVAHVPGPASYDGHSSQRPTSWRRATSTNLNFNPDQRQPTSHAGTAPSSRAPSEAGSSHPRNASKNMESSAYEAGYRDAIARLRADADRW